MAPPYQRPPYLEAPRLLRKPELTVRELAASTSRIDRNNSRGVRLANVVSIRTPPALTGYKAVQGRTLTEENKHKHKVTMFHQDYYLTKDSKVIADCTCGRHCFYYEVANAQKGASFIYRSNGDRPRINNPSMQIGLCKHAYAMASYLIKQGKEARQGGKVPQVAEPVSAPPRKSSKRK